MHPLLRKHEKRAADDPEETDMDSQQPRWWRRTAPGER